MLKSNLSLGTSRLISFSPVSSIWDFPDLVDATTAAVACVTPREACCRRCRLELSLSALTWGQKSSKHLELTGHYLMSSCASCRKPPVWISQDFVWVNQCNMPTLDAATSCAVLAAISCEHTINSSNFPLPCTTRSAASLDGHKHIRSRAATSQQQWTIFTDFWTGLLISCFKTFKNPCAEESLTPWPWHPNQLLWRQRSGPQSNGSSWHKIPSWMLPPGGRKQSKSELRISSCCSHWMFTCAWWYMCRH